MKTIIVLILLLLYSFSESFSQSYSYNVRIAAHIVRNDQGQYGISASDVNTSVLQVNNVFTVYNSTDIHFTLAYTDNIDESYYTTGDRVNFQPNGYTFTQKLLDLFNEKNEPGVIHVYYIKKEFTMGGAGVSRNIPGNKIVVTNEDAINGETLAHEIGHCLGLLHTYESTRFNIQPDNNVSWSSGGQSNQPEWVARSGTCSNCSTNGDLLCDTPADPIDDESGVTKYVYECSFHNTDNRDDSDCEYLFTGVLINNIMAFSFLPDCHRSKFTNEQINRMKAFLDLRLASINNTIAVQVANKFGGSTIANSESNPSTLRISNVDYNSGGTAYLLEMNYTGKTNQERFVNYQSNNIKHHDWNNIFSEYYLSENFTPSQLDNYRDANFFTMNYGKIEVRLEGQLISSKGAGQFHDPWFVLSNGSQPGNYWKTFNSFYEPTGKEGASEKGIFLNQEIVPDNPYYSVKTTSPQDIDLGGTLGTHRFYFQNWGGTNVDYDDANDLETGVVFTNTNATVTANLKGTELSTDQNAYANNSQRKLVKDSYGHLHKVYTSMGRVWYEKSTNNGTTWTIENDGKPLSTNESKHPAIDYNSSSPTQIIIVWQEKYIYYGEESFKIKIAHRQFPSNQFVIHDVFDDTIFGYPFAPYSSYNATPVIAWADNKVLVVWNYGGPRYRFCHADYYLPTTFYTSEYGEQVDFDYESTNPTIAVKKDQGTLVYHLAWQHSTNSIKYCTLIPDGNNNITISPVETPSTGDGFNYNVNPSISFYNGYPTLVWVGSIYESATTQVTKTIKQGYWRPFSKYGSYVYSPTEYNSAVVWSTQNNVDKLYRPSSGITTLNTVGKYIQLSNGSSYSDMYAVSFNQGQLVFQTSPSIGSLSKGNSIVNQCGREGIIAKEDAEFYFIAADVTVDNQIIQFKDIVDTSVILNINELNNYLSTNTFSVNETSNLNFSIAYGINDSLKALDALNDGSEIQYNIELVDANTNEILGVLDNFVLGENNIYVYNEQTYNINTQGIGNRAIKLRVTSSINFEGAYYLADIFDEENVLGKSKSKELSFTGGSVVTSYDLYQNYPNPFNPATTIKYQIPQDGLVTLKIYDILGSEVATLVNEVKTAGRYEVNFNASSLASGVYLYRIQVNDFVNTKKMILMK